MQANSHTRVLCFVDRASRYIYVTKTNLMHCLSSVYLISPVHPNPTNRQSTKKHNTYQLLYINSIPPDDGLQICPKHVEVDWRNKLRINSASSWFLLHRIINEVRIFRRFLCASRFKDPNLSYGKIFPPNNFSQQFCLVLQPIKQHNGGVFSKYNTCTKLFVKIPQSG
jgi:hypothetical protein